MKHIDDLIREDRDTDALRMMAREMYEHGKIGHTRMLLMVRVADKLDESEKKMVEKPSNGENYDKEFWGEEE